MADETYQVTVTFTEDIVVAVELTEDIIMEVEDVIS